MNDSISTKTKIEFLKKIGTDKVNHKEGGTLLDHLINTSERLRDMRCEDFVQDAGLFHSVYGTVYFMPEGGLVENRQNVKDLIGEQAEEIAYLFCIIDNPRIENIWNIESDSLRKDLMLLEQANRDEQSEAEMMTWEEAYDV